MSKRFIAPIATAGLLIGQLALAGLANAQSAAANASAADYVHSCSLLTGTDRMACFDQLPWRIAGATGQRFSWLGNTPESARMIAAAPVAQQFIGTSFPMTQRPYGFIDLTSPL